MSKQYISETKTKITLTLGSFVYKSINKKDYIDFDIDIRTNVFYVNFTVKGKFNVCELVRFSLPISDLDKTIEQLIKITDKIKC
jgi:hypothetical protein